MAAPDPSPFERAVASDARGATRLVAFALAHLAHGERLLIHFPLSRIAAVAGVNERTVREAMRALEHDHQLIERSGSGWRFRPLG